MSEQDRFAFGKNWASFLQTLDEERICRAEQSLQQSLQCDGLEGKAFLDLGCGSGLFSLAAHRLGAEVVSIDVDPDSIECTRYLRENYGDTSRRWEIQEGSVLDDALMESLGSFDVVYSWGVLHHTGKMHEAIAKAAQRTRPGGQFLISIYNDQGGASRRWHTIKRLYNRLPRVLRPVMTLLVAGFYETKFAFARLLRLKHPSPRADWRAKKSQRGMSPWHDWVDWVGGLPFEVARPEEIVVPLRQQGFALENLKTVGKGWGCNEFLFIRES